MLAFSVCPALPVVAFAVHAISDLFTDDGQSAWHARWYLWRRSGVIERFQKADQVFLLLLGQFQLGDLDVLAKDVKPAAAAPAVIVKIHNFFKGVEGAVVHVGRGAGHVAQARRFEHSESVLATEHRAKARIGIERGVFVRRYGHAD